MAYAFVSISRCPWISGERVIHVKGGRVITESLEVFVPIFITDDDTGKEIMDKLLELDKGYGEALSRIEDLYYNVAHSLIPKETIDVYNKKLEWLKEEVTKEDDKF